MIRRLPLVAACALVAAPFIGPGSAGAAGEVLGRCTSVKGSSTQSPGLGHDPKALRETSPDTVPGATPNTISGCSQKGGGGPTSATYTFHLTSTKPFACPQALGGPREPPVGTVIETGTAHIVWSSGRPSNGTVKVKTTSTVAQLKVIIKFTSGRGFLRGHTTETTFTNAFALNQATFDCSTPGNPNPIAHVNNTNVGDAVLRRVRNRSTRSSRSRVQRRRATDHG